MRSLIPLCMLVIWSPLMAQQTLTPSTLSFDSTVAQPVATLADMAWLAGHWRGPALGGLSEEIWSDPEAGSMMGMYRLMQDDAVVFYEILSIQPIGRSLVMKLKHFNADLTGWEEKDEVQSFRLLKLTATEAWFEGMTFRHPDPDQLEVLLAIEMEDGSIREEEFRYERVRQGQP